MAIFKGSGVAIVTPMKENLEVNYEKLEELIDFQVKNGTDCIIIAGTTGESSTLTMEEHSKVIEEAIHFARGRVPVVAGTGSNCTATAVQLSKEAEEAGADGLLIVTPYYNKATQAGLGKGKIQYRGLKGGHGKCGTGGKNHVSLRRKAGYVLRGGRDRNTAHGSGGPGGYLSVGKRGTEKSTRYVYEIFRWRC